MAVSSLVDVNRRRLYRSAPQMQMDFPDLPAAGAATANFHLLCPCRRGTMAPWGGAFLRPQEVPKRTIPLASACLADLRRESFMKRFLALVGLMIVCTGPVAADYLFIKIDLNKVNFGGGGEGPGAAQPGVQPGVQPGFQPGAQPGVQPGFQPGAQPGGFPGFGGKGGKGKGAMGAFGGGAGLQPPAAPMGAVPMGAVPMGVVPGEGNGGAQASDTPPDRKSTRLNSSHLGL